MAMMLVGKDCVDCKHYQRVDKLHIKCWAKDRKYIWGQCCPNCELKEEGLQEHEDEKYE